MPFDGFTITIAFIILATVVGVVIKRMHRDRCLVDFADDMVSLQEAAGNLIRGKLRVESTGLELLYPQSQILGENHEETSYILYKYEYPNIQAVIRFHDELSEKGKKLREKELKRTYHPRLLQRMKRKTWNFFKVLRDSIAEVISVLLTRVKKSPALGSTLTTQEKYVSQIHQEVMGSVGTSYEPLIERYIGNKVVIELAQSDNIIEYCGILKHYTAEFVEIMDIDYYAKDKTETRKADMVVLRKYGVVRHLGEKISTP